MNDTDTIAPFSIVQISKRRFIVVRAMGSGKSWGSGSPEPDYRDRSLSPVDEDGNAVYFGRDGVSAAQTWDLANALAHRNAFNAKWDRYRKSNSAAFVAEDDRAGVSFAERTAPERPSERAMRLASADRANHDTAVKRDGVHNDPACLICHG